MYCVYIYITVRSIWLCMYCIYVSIWKVQATWGWDKLWSSLWQRKGRRKVSMGRCPPLCPLDSDSNSRVLHWRWHESVKWVDNKSSKQFNSRSWTSLARGECVCQSRFVAKVKELTKRHFKIIGVIYQNWKGFDGDEWTEGVPEESASGKHLTLQGLSGHLVIFVKLKATLPRDIRNVCESVQETPRISGENQKSFGWTCKHCWLMHCIGIASSRFNCGDVKLLRGADDEMTIKCAYHRNCCILDNDNYKESHFHSEGSYWIYVNCCFTLIALHCFSVISHAFLAFPPFWCLPCFSWRFMASLWFLLRFWLSLLFVCAVLLFLGYFNAFICFQASCLLVA